MNNRGNKVVRDIAKTEDSRNSNQMKQSITVFIVDDHPLIRFGLRLSLGQIEGIEVVGEAIDGYSAIDKIQQTLPDVALVDVDMPGLSGTSAIRVLRKSLPHMKIIVLSTYHDENYIRDSMGAGADAYVLKNINVDGLANIIKSFAEDTPIFSPYMIRRITQHVKSYT
jgi:DNA-binding NarL/FixJ family response regulator